MEKNLPLAHHYIAFAPHGPGVLCALVYFRKNLDVYGWWTGARDGDAQSAFFRLKNQYSRDATEFYATEGGDLYGGWHYLYSAKEPLLSFPLPIDKAAAQELERIQGMFAHEWLFFDGGLAPAAERALYDHMGFAVRAVNVRSAGIARLDRHAPVWTYESPDFDGHVLDYLVQHWPLDHRGRARTGEPV